MKLCAIIGIVLVGQSAAQLVGKNQVEVHPPLSSKTCTTAGGCKTEPTKVVLDSNWRWLHTAEGYQNCYTGNKWDNALCSDPISCSKTCVLEGANYEGTYGISARGSELTLKFVTNGPYSANIGSRVYLMEDDENYKMFQLLNKEFTIDVDVSGLPCGLNGALYFVQMDKDGGKSRFPLNKAGAAYGTGYCDAQCPHDLKFINGEANVLDWTPSKTDKNSGTGRYGSCCMEMDIWEANSISEAYTSHPCQPDAQYRCSGIECGDNKSGDRYNGVCDKDGCDFNPFRMGQRSFYGPGPEFQVNTKKPFTVVTQFITHDNTTSGDLVEIRRLFKQDGKIIEHPRVDVKGITPTDSITDQMCNQAKQVFGDPNDHLRKGGLKRMGDALKSGMVLTMSLWDDHEAYCLWLDSTYPVDKDVSIPGVWRGTCPVTGGRPWDVEAKHPDAFVKFMNIRVGDLGTTYT